MNLYHPDRKLENQYKKSFFKVRYKLKWRAPIVCNAIKEILEPGSVVDAGCAIGDLVAEFRKIGIEARGIEGSKNCLEYLECPEEYLHIMGLRIPIVEIPKRFDLVTCFEVAEHIEPDFADIFVKNLTILSDRILMSAAPPGSGGRCHWNCQAPGYWKARFAEHGYLYNWDIVDLFKDKWLPWRHKAGIKAYYDNLLYFEKDQ